MGTQPHLGAQCPLMPPGPGGDQALPSAQTHTACESRAEYSPDPQAFPIGQDREGRTQGPLGTDEHNPAGRQSQRRQGLGGRGQGAAASRATDISMENSFCLNSGAGRLPMLPKGTWAQEAGWPEPRPFLCLQLSFMSALLLDAGVHTWPFVWEPREDDLAVVTPGTRGCLADVEQRVWWGGGSTSRGVGCGAGGSLGSGGKIAWLTRAGPRGPLETTALARLLARPYTCCSWCRTASCS